MLNEDSKKFMLRNGFDPELLQEDLDDVHVLRRPRNLNNIVIGNQIFYKPKEDKNISVADIYGYHDVEDYYVLESMSKLFDSEGDNYHRRSVGMLAYSSDEVVAKLDSSFYIEPIQVEEVEKEKYVISYNGLHRFTVLRAHYLIEYEKNKTNPDKLKKIREKYTIPVKCTTMDYLKTYSVFILKECGMKEKIETDYDENYRQTGMLRMVKSNGTRELITDEVLIALAKEAVKTNSKTENVIKAKAFLSPSFNDYVQQYFPELLVEETREEEIKNAISKS